MTLRKSKKKYWDQNWANAGKGIKLTPKKNFFWKRLDKAFDLIFKTTSKKKIKLIEIGAGASEWLPMICKKYKYEAFGLDYSKEGCRRARINLNEAGIKGVIICCDMFNPPKTYKNKFDVVCSFGLVEHFSDTTKAIKACANFLKPNGIIVTLIPNMTGLNGFFYKVFNRNVFDTHVPLNLDQLALAHENANLEIYHKSYLLGLPGIIDKERIESTVFKKIFRKTGYFFTQCIWWWEEKGLGIPENSVTSPYMICAAKLKNRK